MLTTNSSCCGRMIEEAFWPLSVTGGRFFWEFGFLETPDLLNRVMGPDLVL